MPLFFVAQSCFKQAQRCARHNEINEILVRKICADMAFLGPDVCVGLSVGLKHVQLISP